MKVAYISGPIAGYDALNEPLFRAAERRLLSPRNQVSHSYSRVIVPHDIPPHQHEGDCPASYVKNGDHTAACYLREDLLAMLADAHDVWMLPGWEASVGARLELQVATACGLGVQFFHRGDLGCADTAYAGYSKCDNETCWNYRKPKDIPIPTEVTATVRRAVRAESMLFRDPTETIEVRGGLL